MIERDRPAPQDDLPAEAFVRVTALAATLLAVPVALVRTGGEPDVSPPVGGGDVPGAIVAHIELAAVPATRDDLKVLDDPRSAATAFGLHFHASAPMTTSAGREVGRFRVFDHAPRTMDTADHGILAALAAVAAEEIDVWLTANRVRDRERAIADHHQRVIEDTDVLMAAMRSITAYEVPEAVRPAICGLAVSLSGADAAALFEIGDDDKALTPTATAGPPWAWPAADLADRTAAPIRAFVGGKAVLVEDAGHGEASDDAGPGEQGIEFWQPFAAGGSTGAAVIGLAWRSPTGVAPVRLGRLMETFAAEAMRAIERADLLVRLEDLARTDELTGLPNRRALNEALLRELQRARREGHDVSVGILDLDDFKRFNDTLGHPAGDHLLAEAAARWRDALRVGTDILARFGGEEFVVVLPTSIDPAVETLERMRKMTPCGQTASVGVAAWDGEETVEQLLARADVALYQAKAAGRDRIARAAAPLALGAS